MSSSKNSHDHGIDRYHDMDAGNDRAQQLRAIYGEWAETYDHDNDHKHGTVSQPNTVKLLCQYEPNVSAKILDVGCGTGLVGKFLSDAGFSNYDGTDLSKEMLEIAKPRGYQKLFVSNADEGLPVEPASYDACLCVGVFTHGHVGPDGIDELLRVTKSGGLVIFTVNEGLWQSDGFEDAVNQLGSTEVCDLLEQVKLAYMVQEKVDAWYVVMRKL